jgi:hypothetical protein
MHWRALGKSADELVQKLFRADLEMEGIATILNTYVEELRACKWTSSAEAGATSYIERKAGDVGIAVVDVVDNCHSSFSRSALDY